MVVRPYQSRMLSEIERGRNQGQRRICIQLATGAGKTLIAGQMIDHIFKGQTLYTVPSQEILAQTAAMLTAARLPFVQVHGPGRHPPLRNARVVLTTSQTAQQRIGGDAFSNFDPTDVIFDEAHRLIEQHRGVQERWPHAAYFGLTATPTRLDGKSLVPLFPYMVCGPQIADLQADGWLVPSRTIPATMPDLTNVKRSKGDFDAGQLDEAYSDDEQIEEMVAWWKLEASGRRTISFTAGVHASKKLAAAYRRAGVRAEHLDGTTASTVRKAALDRLRRGELDVVCNVGLFIEGVDLVETACIQLGFATESLAKYMQAVGRGLRPSPHTGKRDLLILDHGANALRHGRVDARRDWYKGGAILETPAGLIVPLPRDAIVQERQVALVSPMEQKRRDEAESMRTPARPCPSWAILALDQWTVCERARVAGRLPLGYTERRVRQALEKA